MEKWEKSPRNDEVRIALIACSKSKVLKKRLPAKNIYTGVFFKKAIKYCSLLKINFFILSAKYGLLHPDTIISPYDLTLAKMKKTDRQKWSEQVKKQMINVGINKKKIILLAGIKYIEFLDGEKPLKGLSQGKQLQWLNQQIISLSIRPFLF